MDGLEVFVVNRKIPENFLSEGKKIAIEGFDPLI